MDAENSIDVSQLPQGLYFLHLQLVNGQTVVKKLVVNKE
ncbi:MAG: T9SS type A sorting domain-containing protein [Bacteroidota bacterium]